MTVASETNRAGPYIGNGATQFFSYGFRILDPSHLQVVRADADGVETVLTLIAQYAVTGAGDPGGGTVVLTAPLALGHTLTILRNVPFTQETDLENQGAYYAETIEDALDLAAMRDQQLAEELQRAVKVPISMEGDGGELAEDLAQGIIALAEISDEIAAVGGSIGAVEIVAGSVSEVQTVAANMQAVIDANGSVVSLADASFIAASGQYSFTLPHPVLAAQNVIAWVGGVRQVPVQDYTVDGSTLTFVADPGVGVSVDVLVIGAVSFQDVQSLVDEAEAAADRAEASVSFEQRPVVTTAGVTVYSTDANGAGFDLTDKNHVVFGGSPAGPLTLGVDYSVTDAGALSLNFPVRNGELFHIIVMPRVSNSEAQAILQDFEDTIGDSAARAEAAADRAEAAIATVKNYATRALAVAGANSPAWPVGAIISDGMVQYRYEGAPVVGISDMSGWVPYGDVQPYHFGSIDGVNDEIQINAAIAYVDSIGGGDVWLLGQYTVSPSGTWSASNGDVNAAVRITTTNAVMLRGVRGKSQITLTGTRIAHVVYFGQRVGTSIPARGGIDGVRVVGNRLTAASESVPFEGGIGIYVAGPGYGVRVTNNIIEDTWAYGIGFQRAWWINCLVEGNETYRTGNDGIDCKFDYIGDYASDSPAALEAGNQNNWVRNNYVEYPALRWSNLTGQKAGIDLREGWNSDNSKVLLSVPAVGFRMQHDDPAVTTPELGAGTPDSDDTRVRFTSQHTNVEVAFDPSGTLTGNDAVGATMEAYGIQNGVYGSRMVNVSTTGCRIGVRARAARQVYVGVTARNNADIGFAVYATPSSTANAVRVFGLDARDNGTDVRVYGSSGVEPQDCGFHGICAGTVTLSSGVGYTSIVDDDITTLTDSGTNTMRLSARVPARFKAGRNGTQYLDFWGDGGGNYITAYGAAKPFNLQNLSDGDNVYSVLTGGVHSFRINAVEEAQFDATGLRMPAGNAVHVGGLPVLGGRRSGWTAATGTPTRTAFATGTATTPQIAERLKALIDDLIAHGIIGP